jgi:hypothetical protein
VYEKMDVHKTFLFFFDSFTLGSFFFFWSLAGSRSNNSEEDNTNKESSCNKEKGSIENGSKEEGSTTIRGEFLEMPNLKEFSYGDLKIATKNFKSDALLGEGGFGKVYKGWLNAETLTPTKAGSGMIVAIKKLKSDSVQGVQEWQVS